MVRATVGGCLVAVLLVLGCDAGRDNSRPTAAPTAPAPTRPGPPPRPVYVRKADPSRRQGGDAYGGALETVPALPAGGPGNRWRGRPAG